MNRHCPRFFRLIRQSMQILLAVNPGYTGRVVITVHCKDGSPETVSLDSPDTPKRFEEVTTER